MAWAFIFSAAALLLVFAFYITRNRDTDFRETLEQIALGGGSLAQELRGFPVFHDAPIIPERQQDHV